MDPTRLSKRTLDALEQMPSDKRPRIEAIIAKTQTSEALARIASDLEILDREYRESGRIAAMRETVKNRPPASSRGRDELGLRDDPIDTTAAPPAPMRGL